jgi:hypothetical protein
MVMPSSTSILSSSGLNFRKLAKSFISSSMTFPRIFLKKSFYLTFNSIAVFWKPSNQAALQPLGAHGVHLGA